MSLLIQKTVLKLIVPLITDSLVFRLLLSSGILDACKASGTFLKLEFPGGGWIQSLLCPSSGFFQLLTFPSHNLLIKHEVALRICKKEKSPVSEQSRRIWMWTGEVGVYLFFEILAVILGFVSRATWLSPEPWPCYLGCKRQPCF